MDDFASLNGKLDRLSKAITGPSANDLAKSAALDAKKDILANVVKDTGDRRLSNWPRVNLGAGFELTGVGQATIQARPKGPWMVVNEGAEPHAIRPKNKGKGRARRQKMQVAGRRGGYSGVTPLKTPFGPRFGAFIRRKTRGLKTWDESEREIRAKTPDRIRKEINRTLNDIF